MRLFQLSPKVLVEKVLNLISTGTMLIAGVSFALMMVLVGIGVIMRYLFEMPLLYVEEYSSYLLMIIVCWGLTYTLRTKGHIKVEVVTERLPQKVAGWLELITYLIATSYLVVLTFFLAKMTLQSFQVGAHSFGAMFTPLGPMQLIMLIGVAALALEFAAETVMKTNDLLTGKAVPTAKQERPLTD